MGHKKQRQNKGDKKSNRKGGKYNKTLIKKAKRSK
jgi:hypothetical protein